MTCRFLTPNKTHYGHQFRLNPGLDQTVPFGPIKFDLNDLAAYELTKSMNNYYPLIISLNYTHAGKQFAMMSYANFIKNG